jgi:hypothetical protein
MGSGLALAPFSVEDIFLHEMNTWIFPAKVQFDQVLFKLVVHKMANASSVQGCLNFMLINQSSCTGSFSGSCA